jgi:hypothetical protein
MALLAAMAGVVGAGAAPPPLGLLYPVWTEPAYREALSANDTVLWIGAFLAVFLTVMAAFARSFGLAFVAGIRSGSPSLGDYRRYLRSGAWHFMWSSAFTVPLYLLLFAGEAAVTHHGYQRLLGAAALSDAELVALVAELGMRFVAVLLPWSLLTLPAMVLMYELTPAAMLSTGCGPARSCLLLLRGALKRPAAAAAHLGVRLLLQVLGSTVALLAMLPGTLAAAVLSLPITAVGWLLCSALGGIATGPGAAVATGAGLLTLVVLYCILCTALVPVSVLINAYAVRTVEALGIESSPVTRRG